MTESTISDDVRALRDRLAKQFEDAFLGLREDRGELTFWVMPSAWIEACQSLKEDGYNHLSDLTAVDYLDRDPRFDLMAILSNHENLSFLRVKTVLDEGQSVPSLTGLWSGSNWFEREIFDLFGIEFENHPGLKRILLPGDYQGHPLRKDYPITGPADSAFR